MKTIIALTIFLFIALGNSQQVWKEIYDFQNFGINTIDIDEENNFYIGTGKGIYLSKDRGESWVHLGLTKQIIESFALGFNNELFAGTSDAFYYSPDNGSSWKKRGEFPWVECIAVYDDSTVFIGTDDRIFYSTNNGVDWQRPITNIREFTHIVWSLFVDRDGNIFAGTNCGLYRSVDKGRNWDFIESFNCGDIESFGQAEDGTIYMGGADRFYGVYKSSDGGLTWKQVFDLNLDSHSLTIYNGQIYISSVRKGIFRSTKNDLTWEPVNQGLPKSYNQVVASDLNGQIYSSSFLKFYRLVDCCEQSEIELFNFNINNISMSIDNLANVVSAERGYSSLFWFDGEENLSAIDQESFIISGLVNNEIRVAGKYVYNSLYPGQILPGFVADDPTREAYKLWKVRKNPDSIEDDSLRAVYEENYANWPIQLGAPWIDNTNDGVYTQGADKPYRLGDETTFSIANDLDTLRSVYAFNTLPLGVEVTTSVFGFNNGNYLDDVVFKKFTIINKSPDIIEDVVFSNYSFIWIGLGEADNVVGCDTLLGLAFGYEFYEKNYRLGDKAPHAVGNLLVQGSVVESPGDSALFNFRWKRGYKNLGMYSFAPQDEDSGPFYEAESRNQQDIFNLQHGFYTNGSPYYDSFTGDVTKFPLAGDPESASGWIENDTYSIGERSYFQNTGPLTMAPGDTQEVVFAIIVARGENNLNSVTKLKEKARRVQKFYTDSLLAPNVFNSYAAPNKIELSQNFPNPFNGSTLIKYSVPKAQKIVIELYNNLGQRVKTVLNKYHLPGNYRLNIDAANLASGLYFYTLRTKEKTKTKKMLLLR